MGRTREELLNIARAEIGYKEKQSTRYDLDDPDVNPGSNNFTKYARDLYRAGYYQASKQGCEWCDMFVDWCFYQLCGKNKQEAEAMIYQVGVYGAACPFSANFYKAKGQYFTSNPQPGDQIFFGYKDLVHTGLIEKVENGNIYTIEGNADNMVKRKTYKISDSWVRGFGRPNYEVSDEDIPAISTPDEPTEYVASVMDWQRAAIVDGFRFPSGANGIWSEECEVVAKKAIVKQRAIYLYKNMTRIVQEVVGVEPDGCCGSGTKKAIAEFQRENGLTADGICGLGTWKKILKVDEAVKPVEPESTPSPETKPDEPSDSVATVKEWQNAAIADGFKFESGADGVWGSECEAVAKKAIIKKRSKYMYKNLTKIVQRAVGVEDDGLCGSNTVAGIKAYQRNHALTADGICGLKTWKKILSIK